MSTAKRDQKISACSTSKSLNHANACNPRIERLSQIPKEVEQEKAQKLYIQSIVSSEWKKRDGKHSLFKNGFGKWKKPSLSLEGTRELEPCM